MIIAVAPGKPAIKPTLSVGRKCANRKAIGAQVKVLYVLLGSTIGDLTMAMMGKSDSANSEIQWFVSAIGVVATLGLTIYLAKLARQQITKKLK